MLKALWSKQWCIWISSPTVVDTNQSGFMNVLMFSALGRLNTLSVYPPGHCWSKWICSLWDQAGVEATDRIIHTDPKVVLTQTQWPDLWPDAPGKLKWNEWHQEQRHLYSKWLHLCLIFLYTHFKGRSLSGCNTKVSSKDLAQDNSLVFRCEPCCQNLTSTDQLCIFRLHQYILLLGIDWFSSGHRPIWLIWKESLFLYSNALF